MTEFTQQLLAWYEKSGRHDLPWQQSVTPYRVWISEIMLQQTQVTTVIPYYRRFIRHFPDVASLAAAAPDEVLHFWSGLGYYSRARNLQRAAQIIVRDFNGELPDNIGEMTALPGIGRSTAGAILALSMNKCEPILDGNVKRVLCRYHGIEGWPGQRETENLLWKHAEKYTPENCVAAYTQAIMDLGAMVCIRTNPQCGDCPVNRNCVAKQSQRQNELPHKKPKKVLPVRQTTFVVIENDAGEILLQRRPPTGIWGGLWGFPECPVEEDVYGWIKDRYGYEVDAVRHEAELRHTFSHFRLAIHPVRMSLICKGDQVHDREDLYWYKTSGDNKAIGMAAPVRKLVARLYYSNGEI